MDYPSGIRLPDCSKLAANWKNGNKFTIFQNDVIVNFFWRFFVSLVKFSCWSKFHANIIAGSGVMTISFYKRLTRNPEIGNTPVWFLPIIWRLGRVRNTKFGTNVSNKMWLMLQNAKVAAFTVSELLKENQQGVKFEAYRDFKASIDYRIMTSIDLCRLL